MNATFILDTKPLIKGLKEYNCHLFTAHLIHFRKIRSSYSNNFDGNVLWFLNSNMRFHASPIFVNQKPI